MNRQLVPLKDGPQTGIPLTLAALEWISFHREFNGAEKAGALVKCGGRLYVDPPRFLEWMASSPRISPPVAKPPKTKKRSKSRAESQTAAA